MASRPERRQFEQIRQRIDNRLAELAPAGPPSEEFNRIIRSCLLAPGKRFRSLLTVLTAVSLGGSEDDALNPACAFEMIHTASLIIDDLPAMDDAKLRRGQPTIHRVYGEHRAILAGFALMNQAFDVLSRAPGLDDETRLALVRLATQAIGLNGIIAGQQRDLEAEGQAYTAPINEATAERIRETYRMKTAALFVAAAEAGARVAGLRGRELAPIRAFAQNLGMAYQTRDDLIDRHATTGEAGKDVGVDRHKLTLVSVVGEGRVSELNRGLVEAAVGALEPYGRAAEPLVEMSRILFGDVAGPAH